MMSRGNLYFSAALLERIKLYKLNKEELKGHVYGLQGVNGDIFILSFCLICNQLQHDPTLLLPFSFKKLGSFVLSKKTVTVSIIDENSIFVTYINEELKIYGLDNSSNESELEWTKCTEKDLLKQFVIVQLPYQHIFMCRNKTADVKNITYQLAEQISSLGACFNLKQHSIILQSNLDEQVFLNKEVQYKTIGDFFSNTNRRHLFDICKFEYLLNKSLTVATAAPIVQIEAKKRTNLNCSLIGCAVLYVSRETLLADVRELLKSALVQYMQLIEHWLVRQLKDEKFRSPLKGFCMNSSIIGHFMNFIYPETISEDLLKDYRKVVHEAFLFPLTTPTIRKANKFYFPGEKKSELLINPHEALSLHPSEDREIGLVQGKYTYHHYMQDEFNDNKWGCAYRSLQTLISWFRMQGYTDVPIPSHKEIQQILVDIRDKPASFVGSNQWIGSTEVGFVLENLLKINCRYINVSCGAELASKGRELALHFKIEGTPIMIGGGVLAHTILGVDWSPNTGDIKFLILDPHYTGSENLSLILKQGWCGWKGMKFWNANAYYNLCLPLKPPCF